MKFIGVEAQGCQKLWEELSLRFATSTDIILMSFMFNKHYTNIPMHFAENLKGISWFTESQTQIFAFKKKKIIVDFFFISSNEKKLLAFKK